MSIIWYTCPHCGDRHLGRRLLGPSPDSVCKDCIQVDDPSEFVADHAVRCPKCKSVKRSDFGEEGLYTEGTCSVWCGECGAEYDVEVSVSFTYRSPALGAKELS